MDINNETIVAMSISNANHILRKGDQIDKTFGEILLFLLDTTA